MDKVKEETAQIKKLEQVESLIAQRAEIKCLTEKMRGQIKDGEKKFKQLNQDYIICVNIHGNMILTVLLMITLNTFVLNVVYGRINIGINGICIKYEILNLQYVKCS